MIQRTRRLAMLATLFGASAVWADGQTAAIVPEVVTDTTGYIVLTADDSGAPTSFNSAGHWSDKAAPSSDKDYLVQNNYVIRLLTSGATFAGRSLTLDNGRAKVNLGNNGRATIGDLYLTSGRLEHSAANITQYLNGQFHILGTASNPSRISGCSGRVLKFDGSTTQFIGNTDAVLKVMMTQEDAGNMNDNFFQCWIACDNSQTYAGRFIVSAGNATSGMGYRIGLYATAMNRFGKGDPNAATSVLTLQNRAAFMGSNGLQFTDPNYSITIENAGTIGGVQGVNDSTLPNGLRIGGGVAIKGAAAGAELYILGDSPVEFDDVALSNIGGITVERGIFRLGPQYANSSVPLTVGTGTTLGGVSAAATDPAVTLADGASLSPGNLRGVVGTLGLGSVTAQSTLTMSVDMTLSDGVLAADHLQVNGKLLKSAGGLLTLNLENFPSETDWSGSVTLLTATNLGEADGFGVKDIEIKGFPASWLAVRDTGTLSIVADGSTKHLVWTCVPPSTTPVLRVLPLGDSITFGSGSTVAGYREPLYNLLHEAGYNLDFVGALSSSVGMPVSDPDHEGHVGWTLTDAVANIDSVMATLANVGQTPHVILLHLGTNDLLGDDFVRAPKRLEQLLDRVYAQCPGAWVVVSTLLDRSDDDGTFSKLIAEQFNPFVEEIAARRRRVGQRVAFLDLNTAVSTSNLSDGVHPNDTGYAQMAEAWFGTITNLVPSPLAVPSVTRDDRVRLTATDAASTSSFNSYLHWENGLAPRAGCYYFVPSGLTLRTPEVGGSLVFAGESIVLEEGGFVNLKHASGATASATWVAYGARLANGNGGSVQGLGGILDVRGTTASPTLLAGSGTRGSRQTTVSADLIGTEDAVLRVTRTTGESDDSESKGFNCVFTGDNHAYRGRFEIESGGEVKGPFKGGFTTQSLGAPVHDGPKVTIRDDAILVGNGAAFTNGYMVALDGNGRLEPGRAANLSNRYGEDSLEALLFDQGAVLSGSGSSVLTINKGNGSAVAFGDVKISGVAKVVGDIGLAIRFYPGYDNRDVPFEIGGRLAVGADGIGPVTLKNGADIQPGWRLSGTNALGRFGVASLTMEEGSSLFYTLAQIDGVATSDFIRVYGNLTKACTKIPLVFDAVSDVNPSGTRYPLLAAANLGTELTVDDFVWSCSDPFQNSFLHGNLAIESVDGTNTLVFVQSSQPPVKLTGTDSSGNDSWARPGSWDNGLAPNANYHYVIPSGKLLRHSNADDSTHFAGLSLSILSGGDLAINGLTTDFGDLRLFAGGILTTRNNGGNNRLTGTATVYPGTAPFNFEIEFANNTPRALQLDAKLKGSGDLRFRYYHTSDKGNNLDRNCVYYVTGDNSDFMGGIELFQSAIVVDFKDEHAMGGPAPDFRADRLLFTSNATLRCSSSYVMNDPTRGITFGGGTVEGRQDGGSIEVLEGQTLTIWNLIAGTNSLRKAGSGTLLLCCATNTFSGVVRNQGTDGVGGIVAVGHADALAQATLETYPNTLWRIDVPEGMTVKGKDAIVQNNDGNGIFRVWASALDALGRGCMRVDANLVRFTGATAADADALRTLVQLDEARLPGGASYQKTAVVEDDAVLVKVSVKIAGCTIYFR